MNHIDSHRPYQPDRDGTVGTDEGSDDPLYITTRKIDGCWHVVATEPGRCEHLYTKFFSKHWDAIRLAQNIRRGIDSGLQLDLKHWESRAL